MNMIANIKPTAAEEALLERLAGVGSKAARAALEVVSSCGLPTRRVESWHYTDLRAMLTRLPPPAANDGAGEDADKLADGHTAYFVNGRQSHAGGLLPSTITRIEVEDRADANRIEDAIAAMAALAPESLGLKISGSNLMETPLILNHRFDSDDFSAFHHAIVVSRGSEAKIIERHVSPKGKSPVNVGQVDLTLEKGAKAHWFIVQQESDSATRLARMNITLEEGAQLSLFILNAGGRLVRQEVRVNVMGENASLALNGVNLVGEGAHIDVTTALNHKVAHTTAEELFRNVVTGKGKGVFQGQINVAQQAQKTDAQMACNTLLLTDDSDFSAKPELEIFADDVICAHGATIADISDDHLFYLRARGIDEKTARTMLIKAFVDEVVEGLEQGELGEILIAIIDQWLDGNA